MKVSTLAEQLSHLQALIQHPSDEESAEEWIKHYRNPPPLPDMASSTGEAYTERMADETWKLLRKVPVLELGHTTSKRMKYEIECPEGHPSEIVAIGVAISNAAAPCLICARNGSRSYPLPPLDW